MTSEPVMPDGRRFGGLFIMPGSKGLNPHELAHKWADCGSAKHETIRRHYMKALKC